MKKVLFALLLFGSVDLTAASIEWNCFTMVENRPGEYNLSFYHDIGLWYPDAVSIRAETCVKVSQVGTSGLYSISAVPENVSVAFSGNWDAANFGGIASADTTRNKSSYFHHAFIDESPEDLATPGYQSVRSDYDIVAEANTRVFLMLAVADANYLPWGKDEQSVFYGWVELDVDSSGNLNLRSSAIDLDGGPMIVGGGSAIPEPSSVLLLLAGGALLALRRRWRYDHEHHSAEAIGVYELVAP